VPPALDQRERAWTGGQRVVRYIRYYNTIRVHSGFDYQSPLAFERQAA